jgi:hypothetical protein
MTRQPKLVYAAFLVALLCAGIGVVGARAWHSEAVRPAAAVVHPTERVVFDADYVQGLAKLGIVNLPTYKPSPVLIDARPTK